MNYLIKNARVIDPADNIDDKLDIVISDGRIEDVGKGLQAKDCVVIDAKGMIAAPGLVDMHTHLREPGREDEETIRSGTVAAVAGGFTTVSAMPNTDPAIDSPDNVKTLKKSAAGSALANVIAIGAITEGREGKVLTDFRALKNEGALAVSDDGSSVEDGGVMTEALKLAKNEEILVIAHCEDVKLSQDGVINKGFVSTKMGLRGISKESEYIRISRDIELARKAGAAIHIAHVSSAESVEIIRKAKKSGVRVTAETCPHYFSLTEACCATYDTNTKMNPPLRTKEDVDAIKAGLADGAIDAISTDHAPHTDSEKDVEFDFAPFGIIGLETALSLSIMELVDKKVLSFPGLISKMSSDPARILGIEKGSLKKGVAADIVIIDPSKEYVYTKSSVKSKSKNSPFIGWTLKGRSEYVFVGGRLVLEKGVIV